MELKRWIARGQPRWERLEELLVQVDAEGLAGLSAAEGRELVRLYREVGGDLVLARTMTLNPALLDYLNGLVGRAYGAIHATRKVAWGRLWRFLTRAYPALIRAEARLIGLAAALFVGGALLGAVAVFADAEAGAYLLPQQHLHVDPSDRVAELEARMAAGGGLTVEDQAFFSSYLFTHNIQVTFLAFALGLTFGVGTAVVLVSNGVLLGALAAHYHLDGVATFFYAWILPHGVPELLSVFIAGGAGFMLSRALWAPGRRTRRDRLRVESVAAARLVLGTMALLVVAGVIEGTISQMHPPRLSYAAKLGFAATMAVALGLFITRAGRREP
ncbi:MAG: chromate reductase [Myxococcales bacterium]|nr:chromate reductase [Myxococcales bacterium]